MCQSVDTVVLLTTWNRPSLLRDALRQIEREVKRIGARLVISDDGSSDGETRDLLARARDHGADVLTRPELGDVDVRLEEAVHTPPRDAIRTVATSPEGCELIALHARSGGDPPELHRALLALWKARLWDAHVSTQKNNLRGFRHVLASYPEARWIVKVDDDAILHDGAFEVMRATWQRAEREGHDVLAVSGIRTVYEKLRDRFDGYGVTTGVCNVAVLYRRVDWQRLLIAVTDEEVIDKGFDLVFTWDYAPQYRPGAVAICVLPSLVYHAGHNGVNTRGVDVNCDFIGELNSSV
jgi:glycosyltransferase involved in cell wall biosynthesis